MAAPTANLDMAADNSHHHQGSTGGSASSLQSLRLIDTIKIDRIVQRDGHRYFVLNVYQRHPHHKTPLTLISPTDLFFRTRNPRLSDAESDHERRGEPDFQVERRFSEFVDLRHSLRATANAAAHHPNIPPAEHKYCAFCNPLLKYLSHDFKCPRTGLKLILTSTTQREYLSSFICKIITTVVRASEGSRSLQQEQEQEQRLPASCCDVAIQAAVLLEGFLRKPRGSLSLGII